MKIIETQAVPEAYIKAYVKLDQENYNSKLQEMHMEKIDPADLKFQAELKEIGLESNEAIAKLIDLKPKDKALIAQICVQYGQEITEEQIDKIIKIFS